jgi:hypothetical protein
MRRTVLLALACGLLVVQPPVPPGGARAAEPMRIVPASGGAEVEEISITRASSLLAVKGAQLSSMSLGLWFPAEWKDKELTHQLIRIKSLDPIEDDTGKLLLSEARRAQFSCLHYEVQATESKRTDGKAGPVVNLWHLDAPARRAEAIKSIKGKAEVTLAKAVRLTFDDLDAINGKELDHPDFPALRDMKLKFAIKKGRFSGWTAEMSAPSRFDSPWNFGRLASWDVLDRGVKATYNHEGGREPEHKGGVTEVRESYGGSVKGLSLRLVVLEPVETKTFDFDFRNVPLP